MTRLPYSAKALIAQVRDEKPKAKITPEGEPDGLGVYRKVRFSRTAATFLEPLLEVMDDQRIRGWERDEDGLTVRFVATPDADNDDPFPLAAAAAVVRDSRK